MSLKQNTNIRQAYPSTAYLTGSGFIGEHNWDTTQPVIVYRVPTLGNLTFASRVI